MACYCLISLFQSTKYNSKFGKMQIVLNYQTQKSTYNKRRVKFSKQWLGKAQNFTF